MCIFCEIIKGNIPSSVVYEDENVLAILDISQVTYGHTIVMPKNHTENIMTASEKDVSACINAAKRIGEMIIKNTSAAGFNVLNNCGEAAGQTVQHLHFHVIPRYDENDAISITFNESAKQDLEEVLKTIKK